MMLSLARNGAVATISSRAVSMVFPRILARRLINPTITRPVCLCHPTAIPQTAAALAVEETIRTLAREHAPYWDKIA